MSLPSSEQGTWDHRVTHYDFLEHQTDPAYFLRARQSLGEALEATPAELRRTEEE